LRAIFGYGGHDVLFGYDAHWMRIPGDDQRRNLVGRHLPGCCADRVADIDSDHGTGLGFQ
jgi:hypothetical protein